MSKKEFEIHKGQKKAILDEIEINLNEDDANIFGPELNELLLGRLNLKVVFKNVRIYYEYDTMMDLEFGVKSKFSLCFTIKEFSLQNVPLYTLRTQKLTFIGQQGQTYR